MEPIERKQAYHFEVIRSPIPYPTQDPHEVVDELRGQIRTQFEEQGGTSPLKGALKMGVVYTFAQSHSFRRAERMGEPVCPSGTRSPTMYKLNQVVSEALCGKVIHQTSQVVDSAYEKKYGPTGKYDIDVEQVTLQDIVGMEERISDPHEAFSCKIDKEPLPLTLHGYRPHVQGLREQINERLQSQGRHSSLGGPLRMRVTYTLPRPHSSGGARGEPDELLPSGTRSPDLDHLSQLVSLALSTGGIHHDSQLVQMQLKKKFGPVGQYEIGIASLHHKDEGGLALDEEALTPGLDGQDPVEPELEEIEEKSKEA